MAEIRLLNERRTRNLVVAVKKDLCTGRVGIYTARRH